MKPTAAAFNSAFIDQGLIEIFGRDLPQGGLKEARLKAVKTFGQTETRGMLLRAGRAAFYYWMRENTDALGWREVEFRLLPAPARIKRALSDALHWFEVCGVLKGELTSTEEAWQIGVSGLTGKDARLDCDVFIGLLQELACWAGAGKFYPAREIECQSNGVDCCLFEISKQPAG